jgi:uncharacterized protein YcfL
MKRLVLIIVLLLMLGCSKKSTPVLANESCVLSATSQKQITAAWLDCLHTGDVGNSQLSVAKEWSADCLNHARVIYCETR